MSEINETIMLKIYNSKNYNQAMYTAKIPLLISLLLKGFLTYQPQNLEICIKGICEYGEFIPQKTINLKNISIYTNNLTYKNNEFYIDFDYNNPSVSFEILSKLLKPCAGKIKITVTSEKNQIEEICEVNLYPYNAFLGLYQNPETICTYVTPEQREVEKTLRGLHSVSEKFENPTDKKAKAYEIYKRLQEKNLVYERPEDNFIDKKTELNLANTILNKSLKMYSPLELSLFYASCAEKLRLCPILCFFKGESGNSLIYVGVKLKKNNDKNIIIENDNEIISKISNDEILLFDPCSFTAGHETEFQSAMRNAKMHIFSGEMKLIAYFDIESARKNNIMPMKISGEIPKVNFANLKKSKVTKPQSVIETIKDYENALYNSENNKPLRNFFQCDNDEKLPIFTPDFAELLKFKTRQFSLYPKPEEIDLEEIATNCENFCSLYIENTEGLSKVKSVFGKAHSRSIAEEKTIKKELNFAKEKIEVKNSLFSPLVYDKFANTFWQMFLKNQGKNICLNLGFAKLTINEERIYAPILIYPGKISLEKSKYLFKLNTFTQLSVKPLVNIMFFNEIIRKTSSTAFYSETDEISENAEDMILLYEKLAEYINKHNKNASLTIVKEAYLNFTELSDYYLWLDMAKNKKVYSKNRNIQNLILNLPINNNTEIENDIEFYPPFECDSEEIQIQNVDKSFVLKSPGGSGKKQIVANMLMKNIARKEKSFVYCDNDYELAKLFNRISEIGMQDSILPLFGEKFNEEFAKKKILSAITNKNTNEIFSDEAEKKFSEPLPKNAAFNKIYSYEYNLHKKYNFGHSLYECIGLYELYKEDLNNIFETIEFPIENIEKIDRSGFADVLACCENLITAATTANHACDRLRALPLNNHPLFCITPTKGNASIGITSKNELNCLQTKVKEIKTELGSILSEFEIFDNDINSCAKLNNLSNLLTKISEIKILLPEIPCEAEANEYVSKLKEQKNTILKIKDIEKRLFFFKKEVFDADFSQLSEENLNEKKGFLERKAAKKNAYEIFEKYIVLDNKNDFLKFEIYDIISLLQEHEELEKKYLTYNIFDEKNITNISDYFEQLLYLCKMIKKSDDVFFNSVKIQNKVLSDKKFSNKFIALSENISQIIKILNEQKNRIGIDFDKFNYPNGLFSEEEEFFAKISAVISALSGFEKWCAWNSMKNAANTFGLQKFSEHIETVGATINTKKIFLMSIYKSCTDYILFELDERVEELKEFPKVMEIEQNLRNLSIEKIKYFTNCQKKRRL